MRGALLPVTTLWVMLAAAPAGCGSSSQGEAATPGTKDGGGAISAETQKRLQGTWEIVKYQSKEPIPPEAMPLMGAMFEDLRLNVKQQAVEVDGKASPFQAVDEQGDSFRLKTDGMFNNAACKFNSADEFEVDDQGPTWPGKTVLRRAKK
jgi:hypothetical protein